MREHSRCIINERSACISSLASDSSGPATISYAPHPPATCHSPSPAPILYAARNPYKHETSCAQTLLNIYRHWICIRLLHLPLILAIPPEYSQPSALWTRLRQLCSCLYLLLTCSVLLKGRNPFYVYNYSIRSF